LFAAQAFEPFEAEEEMDAALGGRDGVDFVDDDRLDVAEDFARLRCQNQVKRFRRGDEDFGRMPDDVAAIGGGGVARADGNFRRCEFVTLPFGYGLNADERGAKVAVDVDGERLEGRDVEDPNSECGRR
jgi:hypothetical protein